MCDGTSWACIEGPTTTVELVTGASTPVVSNDLDDLSDVDVSAVADDECLVYDSATTTWGSGVCGSGAATIESLTGATTPIIENDLNDIADVTITSPANDECLMYNSTGSIWENSTCAASAIESLTGATTPTLENDIADIADVTITSPADNQCLVYNSTGSVWENSTCNAGSTTTIESVTGAVTPTYVNDLDDLTDVNAPSPSSADVLYWDGSEWIAQSGITSDRTLKENITNLEEAEINKIYQLSAQKFNMIADPERTHFGFIAQDVQTIYPNLILTNSKGKLSMDYVGLIAPMIEALKELKVENQDLKQRIEALESAQ